jgi:hypothetical protein
MLKCWMISLDGLKLFCSLEARRKLKIYCNYKLFLKLKFSLFFRFLDLDSPESLDPDSINMDPQH